MKITIRSAKRLTKDEKTKLLIIMRNQVPLNKRSGLKLNHVMDGRYKNCFMIAIHDNGLLVWGTLKKSDLDKRALFEASYNKEVFNRGSKSLKLRPPFAIPRELLNIKGY